jgi:hypothetical protein
MRLKIPYRILCLALAFTAATPGILRSQRLPNRIDGRTKAILRGSQHPRIKKLISDGPVEDKARLHGLTLRFRPTPSQSLELEQLLDDQQNPASPLYHSWLTPEEYGRRFGLNPDDFNKVVAWIESQGFEIDAAATSRTYVSFSGTVGQVRETFDTEVHWYNVDGRSHFANVRDASIPAELEPMVYTLKGLDDLPAQRAVRYKPRINSSTGAHALTPGDLAVIYNLVPAYKAGLTGAGQKIAVVGQSALSLQDVRHFRSAAMLPPSEPKVLLVPGSKDPGFTGADAEALMDVQYAGGSAPGATIIYVYATDVLMAVQYAIDQNLAPVLSYSFGECEKVTDTWTWYRNLAQQAVAQGITWVAASGDSGVAACESQLRDSAGVSGIAVNLAASIPEVTGVGGTSFVEGTGSYWAATSKPDGTSALSYIPEKGWNDGGPGKLLTASGGGASIAYPRPAWQTGPGVPSDNARHVPDIAFTASWDHDPYLIIQNGEVLEAGGTSAGAPFFAGVVALLNQFVVDYGVQARPGLGNINPRLYQLAQANRGVFHDVTTGSNIVPCKIGTPDCTTGQYGYNAGPGYDYVTGLGSVDVTRLIENWAVSSSAPKTASAVVLSVEPSPVYQQAPDADGFSWFYTVRLTETAGAPTRITAFSVDDYDLSEAIVAWLGSDQLPANGALSLALRAKNLAVPSEHVFSFGGIDTNGQKWSKQVTASFRGPQPAAQTSAMSLTSDPAIVDKIGKGDPECSPDRPYGQRLILRELNGGAVKLTRFVAGGFDYSDRIASWFGSQTLPALGTLQTKLCWQLNTVPVTLDYEMSGVDGAGRPVVATLKVQFRSLLDTKSGGGSSGGPVTLSAWPGRRPRPDEPRRLRTPKEVPGKMTVAPRPTLGDASVPERRPPQEK